MFPLLRLLFCLWLEVVDPSFIYSYKLLDKFLWIPLKNYKIVTGHVSNSLLIRQEVWGPTVLIPLSFVVHYE